ncbi:DUF1801 domain-containing protein [Kamptonema cortianum]|nr:DUF1801 domain-containing protein [Oscillatoria laete-virens]MDK3158897.1 DUF1801 domain-containing protein [Kamptonema cortianum]MDL5052867.1 DUF1801 domain-containing protein [Oscillatoria laete-virens NRMC-F 0139]
MENKPPAIATIDDYIAAFPTEVQKRLREIRETIRAAAPGAAEKISYAMPTYELDGNLVYFGAAKQHIGFYPRSTAYEAAIPEAIPYRTSKGTLQFPFDQPIPHDLIRRIVEFRVAENQRKAAEKKAKKKKKA